MSGRGGPRPGGRGVGRGRSRGLGTPPARRPGEPTAATPTDSQPLVGRGRGRAAPTLQQQLPPKTPPQLPPAAPAAAAAVAATAQPPTKQMSEMSIQDPGRKRPERGMRYSEPRTRPEHITDKRGASGQQVSVFSNYVVLKNRPGGAIYQYNVSYNPPVESKGLRIGLLKDHEDSLIGKTRAFDGMILYLPRRLPKDVVEVVSQTKDGQKITITIKLTNELSANSPTCLQLLNITFRRILGKLQMKQIGRHFYNPSQATTIPQHKLELWPGFVTSILQYEHNVMLCLDVSHKILRTDTVLDLLYELDGKRNFHDLAVKSLVGEIVLTRYNNRTYRIDDIDWSQTPRSTFKMFSGEEISFIDYYRKNYNMDIHDDAQPLLVSRPRREERRGPKGSTIPTGPLLLVPELCTRTGLSEEARADFRVMKDVAVYTRQKPQDRTMGMKRFLDQINQHPDVQSILSGWNLEFDKEMLKHQARVLPTEKIFQKDASFSYKPTEADWSREMRGSKVISGVPLRNYIVLFTQRDRNAAQDLVATLKRVGPPMGIPITDGHMEEVQNDRTDNFLRAIQANIRDSLQLVIVVLPNNRKDRYDAIKKMCCVDNPVPSQCVVSRTLSKKQALMSVVTKICLQINCKLGGELWAVEIPLKNLMVVGIDTYHDSSTRGRSVGGFIASTNSTLTKYHTQCLFQDSGQELADKLKECMTVALRKYNELNNGLPDRIIVYRDGVGDGQLNVVAEHEVPQMIAAFKSAHPDYKPKFALVVVKKRINTRIFLQARGGADNPPPGTVVDSHITKPEWYDFFLVNQSVRQGTVSPTSFNVIHDTSGLKPDHMQRLTYKLCHLYYNWPGTVRVPAPCQYAHKLAFLVGQSIHRKPKPEIADRLYFL